MSSKHHFPPYPALQRAISVTFIGSVCVAAAIGMYMAITQSWLTFGGEFLATLALIAGASALALADFQVWEKRACHPIGPISLALTGFALFIVVIRMWAMAIWARGRTSYAEEIWTIGVLAWIAAICATAVGLLATAQLPHRHNWVKNLTMVLTTVLAVIFGLLVVDSDYFESPILYRGTPILGILVGVGILGIYSAHRYSGLNKHLAATITEYEVHLRCPRCDGEQKLKSGRSACMHCGLKILIEIEENLCEKCGYALYRLESSTCPECGTSVF